jgi:hypothetical protein
LNLDDGRCLCGFGHGPVAVARLEDAHKAFSQLGADPFVQACATELAPPRHGGRPGPCRPARAQPGRAGGCPTGRHGADQPGGGQPALRISEVSGVPPPQQLHQARYHFPPSASRSSGLTGPARRATGRTAGDRAAGGSSAKLRVEPRVTPWGQCRAARVNCEPWTPHQRRSRRFAFSSISTGLRTGFSRDKYAPVAPAPGKPFSGVLELLKVLEDTYIDLH